MNYHLLFPKGEWKRYLTVGQRRLELWGGLECSVNRVGDSYYDQFERGGHRSRLEDLNLIADLGIRALRYPVLWEHHAGQAVDWSWADRRMERIRELGLEPIVGLVHHGSGPPHTSLLEASFAPGLAAHAAEVAQRYPWVRYFTPVNEPLTTARFSALYGHWYPHRRDPGSFIRALLNQCDAIRQAMRAVRRVIPHAQLVQTEDMGRTGSTRVLAHQAVFDNTRRWLSLDLLCGFVDSEHLLWNHLRENGASEAELDSFLEDTCPPNIIGINHYLTSERFLDERLDRYPARVHGGNGREAYADVSAVRVCAHGTIGPYGILKEAWQRYQLPVAITEAHLGCTREEQLRWLMEIWTSAQQLLQEGVDVRAVTAWSLLGAYDWNSLLTRTEGYYEPGAFDLRSPRPRPTAIAKCLRELARTGDFEHPVLANLGWWRRPERFVYPPVYPHGGKNGKLSSLKLKRMLRQSHRPILITGATGTLGQAFKRIADVRGLNCRLLSRQEMDIANADSIHAALEEFQPWAVVNAAGYVRVDEAESDAERCFRENTHGPARLAQECAARKISLVTFSSDLVFDGTRRAPYVESDAPAPLNIYGRSKAEAEKLVLEVMPSALVVRTSAFFGPWDEYNFITQILQKLRVGESVEVPSDAIVSPTYVPDLVHACLDLLMDGESGLWHLANPGQITWAELAQRIAELDEQPAHLLVPKPLESFAFPARRPLFSALASERGQVMPTLDDALRRYLSERSRVEERETARV